MHVGAARRVGVSAIPPVVGATYRGVRALADVYATASGSGAQHHAVWHVPSKLCTKSRKREGRTAEPLKPPEQDHGAVRIRWCYILG